MRKHEKEKAKCSQGTLNCMDCCHEHKKKSSRVSGLLAGRELQYKNLFNFPFCLARNNLNERSLALAERVAAKDERIDAEEERVAANDERMVAVDDELDPEDGRVAAIGCTRTTRAFAGLGQRGLAVACTRQAGRGGPASTLTADCVENEAVDEQVHLSH